MSEMPGLEGRKIKLKVFEDSGALALVPAVGQQDPAHIKEDHVEGENRRLQIRAFALHLSYKVTVVIVDFR